MVSVDDGYCVVCVCVCFFFWRKFGDKTVQNASLMKLCFVKLEKKTKNEDESTFFFLKKKRFLSSRTSEIAN